MDGGSVNSDVPGPLSGRTGPALFPRTMRASTDAPFPPDHKDLDSIHNFMKSLVSRRPEMLLEEAKAILDGGSELLSSNFASFAASLGINDAAPARGGEKVQERRPGLGRKRARFSLKPNTSQPSVSLESSLNIDQLQDPEEFFSAVERIENARKEIEKHKGGSSPALDQNSLSQNIRQRRPGLLGKSVAYKHRYSSVLSENEDSFISSQEPLEPIVPSGSNCELLQESNDSDVESQDLDVAGSIKQTEIRVNEILDELLSSNNEDLDADGAVSLLQERLQIKPIELSTLSIPDVHDIGKTDYTSLGNTLSRSWRTSLEVQNLVKRSSKETPVYHNRVEESPSSLASPTPPKSPFASISLLKKRILQSNPLRDPFSPLNIDLSMPKNISSVNQVDSNPDEVNGLKRLNSSDKLNSLAKDRISKPKVSDSASEKVMMGGSDSLADQCVDENSSRQSSYIDVMADGSHSNLGVHQDGSNVDATSTKDPENNNLRDESDWMNDNVEDGSRQVVSPPSRHDAADYSTKSSSAIDSGGSCQLAKNAEDMPAAAIPAETDTNIEESMDPENLNSDQRLFDESRSAATEGGTTDMQPSIQKLPSMNRRQKRRRSPIGKRERKTLSSRPSIADAGTSFEAGVRRSKRIKTRPLEYWKGERFLYGRINDSLKLIGLRYISPNKDDGKLKVKPYISHEFNELLEFAAKH